MALSLTRKEDEQIFIGDDIVVTVASIQCLGSRKVRLAITAPREVPILRGELYLKNRQGKKEPNDGQGATEPSAGRAAEHVPDQGV